MIYTAYAAYFDIDWHPVRPELENKVLLPILEDQYGDVLEAGKLRLAYEDGAFFIRYYATRLPVAPRSYSQILRHRLDDLTAALGEEHEHIQELQSILTAIHYITQEEYARAVNVKPINGARLTRCGACISRWCHWRRSRRRNEGAAVKAAKCSPLDF